MRYRTEIMRELYSLENRVASTRKTLANTANATAAKVSEAVLSSLEKKVATLKTELATAPEDPPRQFFYGGDFPCLTRTTPFTETEMDALEIPDFLRRQSV